MLTAQALKLLLLAAIACVASGILLSETLMLVDKGASSAVIGAVVTFLSYAVMFALLRDFKTEISKKDLKQKNPH